jgi:hypothetical protein
MGRFDKVLEGEKKLKGVKRKVRSLLLLRYAREADLCLQFEPTEAPVEREKAANLALIQKMEKEPRQKKARKDRGQRSQCSQSHSCHKQRKGQRCTGQIFWEGRQGKANQGDDPHSNTLITSVDACFITL